MENIKLIVSEVDGILTDGTVPIDELGYTSNKSFFVGDFEEINQLKKKVDVVFISSDNQISYHLFRRKNIPFYWAKKDKFGTLLDVLRKYSVTAEEVVFIGAFLSDVKCATMVPNSFCPLGSNIKLSNICTSLSVPSGKGVLTDLYLRFFQ